MLQNPEGFFHCHAMTLDSRHSDAFLRCTRLCIPKLRPVRLYGKKKN